MMRTSERIVKTVFYVEGLVFTLTANPPPAYAIQTHGAPEGLYVHQGAHLFLIISLLIFLANIRRSRLEAEKAWRMLFWGSFLFILWNIWAFFGHVAEAFMPESVFITLPGHTIPSLLINSWREATFYVFKMDHLLSLPALIFFYAGLNKIQTSFYENNIQRKRGQP